MTGTEIGHRGYTDLKWMKGPLMDVAKREDALLDKIAVLVRNRNAALDWISTYIESGVMDVETGEWLRGVLNSE